MREKQREMRERQRERGVAHDSQIFSAEHKSFPLPKATGISNHFVTRPTPESIVQKACTFIPNTHTYTHTHKHAYAYIHAHT